MNRFKHFALAMLVALASSVSANAHDFTAVNEGQTIYYKITSDSELTCAVSFRGNNPMEYEGEYRGNIVIPSSVRYNRQTYSVTSIEEGAFFKCTNVTSVEMPNSITSIGPAAFAQCSNITSVYIFLIQ